MNMHKLLIIQQANEGGGVYSSYTTINFNDGTIGHNIAKSNGGGIYQTSGNLNVKGGVITGNEAKGNN